MGQGGGKPLNLSGREEGTMLPSEYEVELLVKERVRDGLRSAEQERLVREAVRCRQPRRRRPWALWIESLLATLAPLRPPEHRCRTLPAARELACQSSLQNGRET
jgi:hypothetical protein